MMKRRYFIWLSVLAGSAITAPLIIKSRLRALKNPLTNPDILSHFCDEETIRKIGAAYRIKFPAENDAKKLKELIVAGSNGTRPSNEAGDVYEVQLDKQISGEFRSNEILLIEGWVLTATEGRQCALLSLTERIS
jgi:hypothetical protein